MPSYKIVAPIKTGGRVRRDGVIEMDARAAAQLVASGFLEAAPMNTHGESAKGSGGKAAGAKAPAAEPVDPAAPAGEGAQSPAKGAVADVVVNVEPRGARRRK